MRKSGFIFWCGACLIPGSLFAQWSTQSVDLNAGWNAVFLEVQPEPNHCDQIFQGMPIESVWKKNTPFSRVQFIQNPDELKPKDPEWLVYIPSDDPAAGASNLFTLQGGESYLIKLRDGAGPLTWTLKGRPVVKQYRWERNRLHFFGFPVASTGAPTFASYFAGSPAHQDLLIYRLNDQDRWEQIADPNRARIQQGHAYWVWAAETSDYSGPLQPVLEQIGEIDFGQSLTEQVLQFVNQSTQNRTVTLELAPSESAPESAGASVAGPVALDARVSVISTNAVERIWTPLQEGESLSKSLMPGEDWRLKLGVRRRDMEDISSQALQAQATVPNENATFQSLLRITDDQGSELLLPVSALGLLSGSADSSSPYAGLWMGYASVDHVSQPADIQSPDTPQPTASPFQLRLLVHVNNQGRARLLQQVLMLWKDGTYQPDPDDPERNIVDQPGRFVLLTDESLVGQYTGAGLRDGVPVGRRLSSAAFSFAEPVEMTPQGAFATGTLECNLTLDYDDPLNPFKHRYHPDHNNLDERYENKLPEGVESFTVIRQIELEFTDTPPGGIQVPEWKDSRVGGIYREAITGLHKDTLHVSGTFNLERISRVPILNDSD